ncbi:hypothetical protein [Azospirillum argentinense]|uniref:Uncharacterized protein n=1 Tax=Azospirillum argentinense TaxID=2970906 RepID=A0A5B0KME5_9PROT|nr:hypothetical protein [Azospirillum argentinense]KAA1053847.1 hypothetical protein FH063_002429 [Azospirillum argentinense]
MAKFIIYRAAGGAEIRARVLTARRDGSQAVEALLFHQVGADMPDLIGDRQRVPTAEVVRYEEDLDSGRPANPDKRSRP